MCQYLLFLRTPSAFNFELVLSIARAGSPAKHSLNLMLLINTAIRQMNSIVERPCIWSACVLMTSSGKAPLAFATEILELCCTSLPSWKSVCTRNEHTSNLSFSFSNLRICGKALSKESLFPCTKISWKTCSKVLSNGKYYFSLIKLDWLRRIRFH